MPLLTEAGHVGFAPVTPLQKALWERLRQRFDRVSDERLVSGAGLENIYQALSDIQGAGAAPLRAAEFFERAANNRIAGQTLDFF